MQSRRKERKIHWAREGGMERGREAVPCKALHNSESEEASEKSSIHVMAMAPTITSQILPAISKQQHLNVRAHLYENLQYYIPIPCSKRPTHPFSHLLNFQQPTITYLKLMIKHFLNTAVWKISNEVI